jgi:rhodanese-related sulfurtransferase
MKLKYIILFLTISTAQLYAQIKGVILNPKYERMLNKLLDHSTQQIGCEELYFHLNEYELLDTREKEEFDISHIPGAKWVGYNKLNWAEINKIPKDKKIVCYCSVGYRSEKLCEKLKQHGFSEVYNLYGSIFEWANRNYELVNTKESKTNQIHAYNRIWGRWMDNKNITKKY